MSDWQPTTCMRCAVGCGLRHCGGEDGVADAHGDESHPVNQGRECQRGLREHVDPAGDRLIQPLVRRGGRLEPTDWDTAIGIVVTQIIEAIRDDPHSVGILGSGQQTNEAAYALGKLARGGIGTSHYDANTRMCMASAVEAYDRAFGGNAPPPTYGDIPLASTHLIWGANPAAAHPVLHNWITESATDPDSTLIVVDPVESQTAREADIHLQPEPGTDLALARAILTRCLETDLVDHAFVESSTEGIDEMVAALPTYEHAAKTTDVPATSIARVADRLADPTLLYWGMGVNQSTQGTATARALIDICLLTGNLGPGCGPFSLTGQANSMGSRIVLSKDTWPGHQPFDDPNVRKQVASTWNVPLSRLPSTPGPGYVEINAELACGGIDVCWTVATNPASGSPHRSRVTRALEDVFLVVQDAFHSDTVPYADVVLPAATWGETVGTTINMERRVSQITAVNEPPGAARRDLEIIAAVGHRIDCDLFPTPTAHPESVFEELTSLTAGGPADLSGITYERLASERAVRWPVSAENDQSGYRYLDDGDWSFDTPSGLARFSAGHSSEVPEPVDETYPYTLTTGRLPDVYNTGVRSDENILTTLPTVRMNPKTIGDSVTAFTAGRTIIQSRRGRVLATVESDPHVPPGVIWLPIHNPSVNELTMSTVDPDSGEPNLKQCAVRLCPPP